MEGWHVLEVDRAAANIKRVRRIRQKAERRKNGKMPNSIVYVGTFLVSVMLLVCLTNQSEAAEGDRAADVIQEESIPLIPPLRIGPGEAEGQVSQGESFEEYIGEFVVAAYCGCPICTGDSKFHLTWSGAEPKQGITAAADLSRFEVGEALRIGNHVYHVEDKVGAGSKETFRLFFSNHEEALEFGRQTLPVFRVKSEAVHEGELLGTFEVTGYCSCEICCGKKKEKLTKSETNPKAGYTLAADPAVLPMGSRVEIDGTIYTVEDTGKAVKGNIVDIYFDTHEEAMIYGRQRKNIYLIP